ncbi:sulfurtransferase TusA family protein [Chengkuizengella axinellae]|uniref:Sulfurtransferase TusA family protein n=1 Tax=Chengkuizengella axinellae TaxID=3064388 RepID=A0ABT9J4X6_9BACL|nr:sulfurtransferase TusA family protein [Chengkuizengella sp. 2205SS18-9]MDP5276676.1 sulfurtransferase TusA family protein [Chengkuizengella sp. 2205SS18-9]
MTNIQTDKVLDAKGLACPMPIVKTKKTINELEPGQVLEIEATDKGSTADLKAWCENTGHQYIGTVHKGNVIHHFVRKGGEEIKEIQHPHLIDNEDLAKKLGSNEQIIILDVREPSEFAFNHIPGAISIPFGELDQRMSNLNKGAEMFVICRTGNRSDLAAQKLTQSGFEKVFNVVPGMTEWKGQTKSLIT